MDIKCGDIYFAELPDIHNKTTPNAYRAVIIVNNELDEFNNVLAIPLTYKKPHKLSKYTITTKIESLKRNLDISIMCNLATKLEKTCLKDKIGYITDDLLNSIQDEMCKIIGINNDSREINNDNKKVVFTDENAVEQMMNNINFLVQEKKNDNKHVWSERLINAGLGFIVGIITGLITGLI